MIWKRHYLHPLSFKLNPGHDVCSVIKHQETAGQTFINHVSQFNTLKKHWAKKSTQCGVIMAQGEFWVTLTQSWCQCLLLDQNNSSGV